VRIFLERDFFREEDDDKEETAEFSLLGKGILMIDCVERMEVIRIPTEVAKVIKTMAPEIEMLDPNLFLLFFDFFIV